MKRINTYTRVAFIIALSFLLFSIMPAVFAADLTGITLHPTDDANAGFALAEGQQAASKWKHSFYRFDLSEIEGDISNATFRVYYEEENAPTFYIGAVENDDWTEDGALPERTLIHDDPALQLDSVTVNGSGYVEFNVTDFVVSQISSDGIVTLELSANTGSWNIVSSKESEHPPKLIFPLRPTDDANTGLALPEGQQAASKWKHSFYRFDVSGIKGSISNAAFRVYYEEENAPTFYIGAVENDDWSEDGVTPERTLIHDDPALQLDSVTVNGSGYVEFNVTDFVTSQVRSDGIVTLELSANTGGWNILSSRESEHPPELIIPPSSTILNPTDDANTGQALPEGQQAASKWKHSFFRFNVSGIEGSINSAKFRVYYEGEDTPLFFIGAVENDDWTEDGVVPERTFIHDNPAQRLAVARATGIGYVEFNVTDFVASQVTGDGIVTLELSASTGSWNIVSSSESDNPPELDVSNLPSARFSHSNDTNFRRPVSSIALVGNDYYVFREEVGRFEDDETCLWDFGDGTSEITDDYFCRRFFNFGSFGEREPTASHTYDTAGEYIVSLAVTNAEGLSHRYTSPEPVVIVDRIATEIDSLIFEVNSIEGLTVDFGGEVAIIEGNDPECIDNLYSFLGTGCRVDLIFKFGDGNSQTVNAVEQGGLFLTQIPINISHAYLEAGTYSVELEVRIGGIVAEDQKSAQLEVTVTDSIAR